MVKEQHDEEQEKEEKEVKVVFARSSTQRHTGETVMKQ